MKKALLLLVAVAVFAACEKDQANALEGKWTAHTGTAMDSHHPLDITFTGDTYVWHIGGYSPMKEEGTFTYENDIITLKGSTFFTCEVEWSQQGGAPVESGAWIKAELSFPSHKYKVLSFEADVLTVETMEDDVISKGTKLVMTRGNAYPEESELKGTWEGESEGYSQGYGRRYRITFDGKNFTRWECSYQRGKLQEGGEEVSFKVVMKESGSWKYSSGNLTLTPTKKWNSYIIHANQYGTPQWYECGTINEATLEASQWWEIESSTGLWESTWGLTKVGKTIYVEVKYTNMDYFVIEQK